VRNEIFRGERFLNKKIEDFLLQKNARPDRFLPRTSFERCEKQPVNHMSMFQNTLALINFIPHHTKIQKARIFDSELPFNSHSKICFLMANFPTNSKTPNIDMTPMVDLGFLLIISFILTIILAKPKAIEMIDYRYGCIDEDSYPKNCIRRDITLLLTESSMVKFYTNPDDIKNSLDSFDLSKKGLRQFILEKKEAVAEEFDNKLNFAVLVKATRNAKYKIFVDAVDELKITNTSFALRRMEAIDSVALKLQ
jgi:biopolymer transport protein ExbD